MSDYTLDNLIDRLPHTGEWRLNKTSFGGKRAYCAVWYEVIGAKRMEYVCHAEKPNDAMRELILQIRGTL